MLVHPGSITQSRCSNGFELERTYTKELERVGKYLGFFFRRREGFVERLVGESTAEEVFDG